jgi:ParB family transcriptional regulator, chromosome partitioning protein
MSKLDALKRSAGGNVAESASRRDGPSLPAAVSHGLNSARMAGVARSKSALEIPLEKIERDPAQPREEFDEEALGRLADSIRARGVLQPIRVRWSEDRGRYVLIAGERRWRAAQRAGLATMTAIVVEGETTPAELLAIQVTENLLREDLNPIERAKAFRTLMDLNGWSGNQLAKELGIAQSGIVQALALLDLPSPVQEQVEQGTLPPATAYEISKVEDPAAQAELATQVVEQGLSRAEAIEAVRRVTSRSARTSSQGRGTAKGKSRKITARTLRLAGRYKLAITCPGGITPEGLLAALRAAAALIEAESPPDAHAGQGEASEAA